MRPYKKLTIISIIITIITALISVLLKFVFVKSCSEFWINVSLAIFGGSFLSIINSLISYYHERRVTLEGLMYHTRRILAYLNKYQTNMTLEQKMKFFLDYYDIDKSAWDADYGNIDFFFEIITGHRKYIYEKIYQPIIKLDSEVANHVWHFRWYFDGTGKNEKVMETFVEDIERLLVKTIEEDVPTEFDDNGNPISYCPFTSIEYIFVSNIMEELNGQFLEILIGKNKKHKQEDEDNGQVKDADGE